ncbi:MAG: hypothetical protein HOO93_17830 [Methyloglobulus sp.]|nr:hypothetical protein [Methyloglobulus sp.]
MNINIQLISFAVVGLILNLSCTKIVKADSFAFGLWGDMPYAKNGDGLKDGENMTRLVNSMNASGLAFTVFDGDTKDGSSVCTDSLIGQESIDLFNKVKAPTVYVLGDNEWTDCHRTNNGGYNNLERLDFLRQTMFVDDYSFGKTKMRLHRQDPAQGLYSENSRWLREGVVFVGLNVPGSNNNKVIDGQCINAKSVRTQADCDADNAEYQARDAANIAFLRESFQLAKQHNAAGLMVVIQADPSFDLPETETFNERTQPGFDGYDAFLAALTEETNAFTGQVVLVHGDTHFYKVDKPLVDQAHLVKNFTRVETFGSPNLHWIKVSVNTKNPNVFTFQPVIVSGN